MDEFCGSAFWDSDLTWNTETPRLAPCFEETVLVWLPCGFLWVLAPFDFLWNKRRRNAQPLPMTPLNLGKIGVTLTLIILEAYALFQTLSNPETNRVSVPVETIAHALPGVTYILFLILLIYSRHKGVHSSAIHSLFWLLLLISTGIKFIGLIQDAISNDVELDLREFIPAVIYFPLVCGQFALHLCSDGQLGATYGKGGYIALDRICPEESASFASKLLFHWFTPLVWRGFRKPLDYNDLWELNEQDTSETMVPKFDSKYEHDLSKCLGQQVTKKGSLEFPGKLEGRRKKEAHVAWTLLRLFGPTFCVATLIRLFPDLLVFVSPQILTLLIDFVETGADQEPLWKGLLYAALLFLAAFVGTVMLAQATHRFYLAGMRARTALVSAIYRKALLLSNSAKRESTMGEIVNLMAVDVQRATEFFQYAYLFWSAPIQIGLALYFLWGILGPSSLAGLVVMILLLPLNAFIAKKMESLQKIQMQKKDERVKLMNEILSGIKVLKLYAWEVCFEEKVMAIRKMELQIMKEAAIWNGFTTVLWQCAPFFVSLSTFATFVLVDRNNILDASKTFVSLSLFNIMNSPLTFLPFVIVSFVQAGVSVKRIDRYLNSDEIDTEVVSHDDSEVDPIVIERGSFTWEKETTTLRNINMRIPEKSFVAVVGAVGSGKSSLLSAMLGELDKVDGRVNTKGSIAYVSQQAWIQNATLRNNILFGKQFDHARYHRVIEACALKPDLEILPAGDLTEIGEKGINLSGGQKQRVALARATYADMDLYLFDDPLSAVDAHVGKHIFEQLIGPRGMLRRKTRVLVTHGIAYLPFTDYIYVMKNGEITRAGTYQTLINEKGEFADFLKSHINPEDVDILEGSSLIEDLKNVLDEESLVALRERRQSQAAAAAASESELFSSVEQFMPPKRQSVHERKGTDQQQKVARQERLRASIGIAPVDKLIEAERSETDSVKISVYLNYFKAAGIPFAVGTFVLYLVFQVFAVGGNLWLSEWSAQPSTTFAETRDFFLGIYGGFGVFQVLSILGATIIMACGTVHSASTLHFGMLKRIFQAPMYFFDTTPMGRIVNRFAKDVDIIDSILPMFIRFWLNGIFSVLATLVVISYSTPIFIAVIIPIMVFYYLVQKFYISSSRQLKRLESVTRSPIYSHFGETISGASTIRAYRQQERFVRESEAKVDHNQISYYSSIVANRWLAVRLETIGNMVVLFAALFAVLGRDTLDAGIVGLSVSYALQITLGLLMLVRFTSDVETNIVAVERLQEYSNAPQEAPLEIPDRKPPKTWPENGEVVFTSYQTRYRPGLELVLRDVTCTIKPSEKIGIVGRTGAGKSSLTLALFRIVEAAGGKISIDGRDISRLGLHDIRGRIAIIPQDPVLFSGSLRLNLDPFDAFSDETIWRSLELAHLKPFAKSLPAGLSHEISEGGENLSVGQRQLICLARALLRKTKILVLDEATAAVDLDTDDLIQQTIRKEFKNSTVITIAHRLNTILDSTRVLVLDKGEIREFDPPQDLLNNPNSLFSKMAKDAGL